MKIGIKKEVEVEAKTIKIHMKVRDEFECTIVDQDGQKIKDYEGYVPGFMPEEHYGDYLILDIDIDTGQITNWVKPKQQEIQDFINGVEE